MDFSPYIQPLITILSSGAILLVLRQQIKSQQEQISAMKSYMEIIKVDEIKKYVGVMDELAVGKAQLAAEKIIKETLNSTEWTKKIFEPFENKMEKMLEREFLAKGHELFHNAIDSLSCLPQEEMESIIKENYPLNSTAMLDEFREIQKNDPDFLKTRRENYLESLPESLRTDEERNRIQQ